MEVSPQTFQSRGLALPSYNPNHFARFDGSALRGSATIGSAGAENTVG